MGQGPEGAGIDVRERSAVGRGRCGAGRLETIVGTAVGVDHKPTTGLHTKTRVSPVQVDYHSMRSGLN